MSFFFGMCTTMSYFFLQFNGDVDVFAKSYILVLLLTDGLFHIISKMQMSSGTLLGWNQQCNGKWRCICILISTCDSSWPPRLCFWSLIDRNTDSSLDCLRLTSPEQPAEEMSPIRLHLSSYNVFYLLLIEISISRTFDMSLTRAGFNPHAIVKKEARWNKTGNSYKSTIDYVLPGRCHLL